MTVQRVELAGIYEDHGLIFSSGIGTPLNPENLVKRPFKPLLERSGLPEVRFHDLRHTCATLLMGRGVHPKLVQELLGHATIALTLDTYPGYLLALSSFDGGSGVRGHGRRARMSAGCSKGARSVDRTPLALPRFPHR